MVAESVNPAIQENGANSGRGANADQINGVVGREKSAGGDPGDNHLRDIDSHANRLFNLLSELRSIANRACDAALREADCADRIEDSMNTEIAALQDELKKKGESLQARELALAELEERTRAHFAELESRVQQKEIQLNRLTSERKTLIDRLNGAELVATQAKSQAHQFTERLEAELTSLRRQMAKREESLAVRELALNRIEGDLKTNIQNLQLRSQETEAKLASQERAIREKERVIQGAAAREAEIGKLIERLSAECDKLSAEVCEKGLLIARLEDKTRHFSNGGNVLKKVFGLTEEKSL